METIANFKSRFVEFETAADLKKAVDALDGREFKEHRVTCTPNVRFSTPDSPLFRGSPDIDSTRYSAR